VKGERTIEREEESLDGGEESCSVVGFLKLSLDVNSEELGGFRGR